jgi:hypothetical protein
MGWPIFWAILSQSHLVTLPTMRIFCEAMEMYIEKERLKTKRRILLNSIKKL